MKFTTSETCRLVTLYGQHECLWNKGSKTYGSKNAREVAEFKILRDFGKDGFGINSFRQKIKNLRCTYNQECLKIRNSIKNAQNGDEIYVPVLKWFNDMDSYLKNTRGRVKTGSLMVMDTSQDIVKKEDEADYTEEIITMPLLCNDSNSTTYPSIVETSSNAKRPKLSSTTQPVKDVYDETNGYSDNALNESDAFALFVGASLKNLSARDALLAQNEIQGILLKYRLNAET